jgi:hypothetical protein
VREADAIVCINMIHIAPWEACLGLMRGAGEPAAGRLAAYLYGAMKIGGEFTRPSNAEIDASLRARDHAWGVRDLEPSPRRRRACASSWERTEAMRPTTSR